MRNQLSVYWKNTVKEVETARRLTDCIGEVRRWMALHMLKLNDEKTKMMIFTSKHHMKTCGGCSLTIGDDRVSPSDRIRNLGVHMDEHLSMTDHVTAVCAACDYHLYRLSSIGPTAPPNNRTREKCSQRSRHLSPGLLQLTVT